MKIGGGDNTHLNIPNQSRRHQAGTVAVAGARASCFLDCPVEASWFSWGCAWDLNVSLPGKWVEAGQQMCGWI